MKISCRHLLATLGGTFVLAAVHPARAQSATVTLATPKQSIRGFGGMVHTAWTGTAGDLTAAERTLAFGNADGQLGFTVLRIPVTDGSPDSANLADAQAAIAAGAIVYATPWNGSGSMNSAEFASYATHLNDFVAYMKGKGVDLYAISVQNEPDYATEGGWRAWTAAQCHDFVLNYGATISTRLISCESFNYAKGLYDPILNDSAALANMAILGTHLYGTPVSGYSYPLFDSKAAGKERWMTEHYTDSNTDANSWPNALNVATELHHAMVEGSFNVYTWWYIKRSYGAINNGAVTKRGWCMAHWSKFVRPGFRRVDATASPTSGVFLSAYKSDTDVVIIVVNTNTSAKSISVTVNGSDLSSYDRFTTSSSKSLTSEGKLSVTGGALAVSLDASSVTTLRASGASTPSGGASNTGGSSSTGGSAPSGGAKATGGATGAGGSTSTKASGGTRALGGSSGANGGAPGNGGAHVTGGIAGIGGTSAVGGEKALGGTKAVGGSSAAAGGSTANGGRSSVASQTGLDTGGTSTGATGDPANTGGLTTSESTPSRSNPTNEDQLSTDEGRCSCHFAGQHPKSQAFTLLSMLMALASLRRRKPKARSTTN